MWNKLNKLSQEKFGEDFSTLSEKEMATLINIKKANKIAEEEFGEFGFATCKDSEMKKIINANSNLIKNSMKENKNVTKQSILKEVKYFQKIAGLLNENESQIQEDTDLDKIKSIFPSSQARGDEKLDDPTDVFKKNGIITVVLPGKKLGYRDNNVYEISWDPSTGEVSDEVYTKDGEYAGGGSTWSEPIDSVEKFISVLTQDAEGSWD
jgi:hypothetical protein